MPVLSRRDFLHTAGSTLALAPFAGAADTPNDAVAFFLVGDTHYFANKEKPEELDATSHGVNTRLVDWLNKLPGTEIPAMATTGKVLPPRGLIHAGDLIDTGDKSGSVQTRMQATEWAGYQATYGLTGKDGLLKYPTYEVHGNHDSPSGTGRVIDGIKKRNQSRLGLVHVSGNGLHYSWDWGPVHFIALGIVVGAVPEVSRKRRYAPLDSLAFLKEDLARHAKERERPVVITHHVDMARYALDPASPTLSPSAEWDAADVRAYHEAVKGHNIVAILYGHTHVRNVYRWDGSRSTKAADGIAVFNTDNAAHFNSQTQAFLYFEIGPKEVLVREFATTDAWKTGAWTPQTWRAPVVKG